MRAAVIANPVAGRNRRVDYEHRLAAVADALGAEVTYTQGPGDARVAAQRTVSDAVDLLIVSGGDGTVNEVVNGLLATGRAASDLPGIGILPTGTCNVLANELGLLEHSDAELSAVFARARLRPIDVGIAHGRCFVLMAGFGFDAAAVQRVALPIKGVIGSHAYLLSALATLPQFHESAVRIEIDDDVIEAQAYMVLVANVSSYAYQNMKLAPFAALDDGWLDVCVFEKALVAKVAFVSQLFKSFAGRHLGDPGVRYFRAHRVSIACEPAMPAQLDGELFGETPMTLQIARAAVNFVVDGGGGAATRPAGSNR